MAVSRCTTYGAQLLIVQVFSEDVPTKSAINDIFSFGRQILDDLRGSRPHTGSVSQSDSQIEMHKGGRTDRRTDDFWQPDLANSCWVTKQWME
jgi:hypothetical protein